MKRGREQLNDRPMLRGGQHQVNSYAGQCGLSMSSPTPNSRQYPACQTMVASRRIPGMRGRTTL
jgi:hypothetical protein